MEFLGLIEFNGEFIHNVFLGFLISTPLFIMLLVIKNWLPRLVLFFGILVYVFPFFIVKGWAYHDVSIAQLLFPYFFLIVEILIFIIIQPISFGYNPKLIIPSSSRKSTRVRFAVTFLFLSLVVCWTEYFLLFPEYSALFVYYNIVFSSEIPRFVFYHNPELIQLLYVLSMRVVMPALIIYTIQSKNNSLLFFMMPFVTFLLLQSGERQNFVIFMFVLVLSHFYYKKSFTILQFLIFLIPALGLIQAINMQGNIAADSDSALFDFFAILFNRIIVDPFYMYSYVTSIYDGPLLFGSTNRIFNYIGLDYNPGWSAIGILPDLIINYGYTLGFIMGIGMFTAMIKCAIWRLSIISSSPIYFFVFILFTVSLISFYYSNSLSIVPFALFAAATFLSMLTHVNKTTHN